MPYKGTFKLHLPFIFLISPKLMIDYNEKNNDYSAVFKWFKWKLPTEILKAKNDKMLLSWHVDIVHFEMEIYFESDDLFSGVVDFPIGHFKVKGKRLKQMGAE